MTVRDGSCCGGQLLSRRSAVGAVSGKVVGNVFVVRSSFGWLQVVVVRRDLVA